METSVCPADLHKTYTLSVIVPAYNEQEVLPELHRRLRNVLETLGAGYEILYINDGSLDATIDVIRTLQHGDPHVTVVNLSRNFGKEIAMTAGLDLAGGDAVVIIDADLQDPPELIPNLIARWRDGYDVVYARRISRDGETWLKKATAGAFYRIIRHVGPVSLPENVGDFRLLSRRAVNALNTLRERRRFMKGLFAWIGYRQTAVDYHRDPRFAGTTKWNYWRLWNFALEGITSFSTLPLKMATYLGFTVSLVSFVYGATVIYNTLLHGNDVKGYPSLMTVILFLGGVQLMGIGVLGEYLGRMFDETKNRPLYFIEDYQRAPTLPTESGT